MTPSQKKFYDQLPKKRSAAMGIISRKDGKMLIVKPTYRDNWLLPGGIIKESESPKQCCARELKEELGLTIAPGRLLVVDYKSATEVMVEGYFFVFDCGILVPEKIQQIKLPPKELADYRFVDLQEAAKLLVPALARRLTNYPEIINTGKTLYLEDGVKR